ncbi:nickel uptake regulator, Fur family [Micromonospora pallida]|uniref:Nickel uptake regulator, Fur family n=1 Tax=Micromonospora pallida TaxID=145854 RepID=A0A1C6TF22_9ACTN|nr:Fur family transcriptional regulator [Micromonospora pallida]SCL40376.1 nickel uptake regulator, Fur family [Micromonospora pallida]
MSEASLAELLRSRGLRLTPQRQLVLQAVLDLEHATPEQVHTAVREVAAGVNITTIYRTLELLEKLGLVKHTHLSHGSPTYHAAGEHQHIHLVCRECGKIEEVQPELLRPVADRLLAERGFAADVGHVALFGICGDCGSSQCESGEQA